MQVVYSEKELLHNPSMEMTCGELKPYVESPQRLVNIKQYIDKNPRFNVIEARDYSLEPILKVHEKDYLEFLKSIHRDWVTQGFPPDACIGDTFSSMAQHLPREIVKKTANKTVSGKLGFYTADASSTFMKDTWVAAYASAQVVLTAAHQLIEDSRSIYALCRPPGHHASHSFAAGYCYINNAAVAARCLQAKWKNILIVDIDYHHGNGSQEIFYKDPSVFYTSLHAEDYPYFSGSVEEEGEGAGLGFNLNVPLPKDTTDDQYLDALDNLLHHPRVVQFKAEAVIISMGLDTWHQDPIAGFNGIENTETYKKMGALFKTSTTGLPVLFIQEGGYTVERLGELAVNVLEGYLD
ncbi:unnamed protein product [Rhizopus stolonifer]